MACLLRAGGLNAIQRLGVARRVPRAPVALCRRARSGTPNLTRACVVSTALVVSERKRYSRHVLGEDASLLELRHTAPEDFYALLRVKPEASAADVKAAYRKLAKVVHPDLVGPAAHSLAIVMNIAVATLCDEVTRAAYDAALLEWRASAAPSFDGLPVSLWGGSDLETEAIFVDECACIGCGKCVNVAPATFMLENEFGARPVTAWRRPLLTWRAGRARVHTQWGDDREAVAEAVATCPVSTISYVQKTELALLEWVMKSCTRENIAVITRRRSGNFGSSPGDDDPFAKAAKFLLRRRNAALGDDKRLQRAAQDDALAATIAKAFLSLDLELRERVWPESAPGH
jgi:curved DNA-binding protein CbpA